MLIANKVLPRARGLAPALVRRAATLTLDWDTRQKSRFDAVDSSGRAVGVVLARGTLLRGGDVLVGEDGTLVVVQAAAQSLLQVTAPSAFDLLRAAYHLGNRHVALEVHGDDLLQLEADHVLADLLRQMGMAVTEVDAPFEPEGGAYAAAHGHAAATAAGRAAIPIRAAAAPHVHGPGCGHDHGHGPAHRDAHDHGAAPAHAPAHADAHEHGHDHVHVHALDDVHDPADTHSHDHEHGGGAGHRHDHG